MAATHRADDSGSRGVVRIESPLSFDETLQRLQASIVELGGKIFCTIDQRAEAAAVGLELPPTTLLLFGNPEAGTPLMLLRPLCAIDLPLKLLVSETPKNHVTVSFNAAHFIVDRHSLPPELAANLSIPEKLVAKALATALNIK